MVKYNNSQTKTIKLNHSNNIRIIKIPFHSSSTIAFDRISFNPIKSINYPIHSRLNKKHFNLKTKASSNDSITIKSTSFNDFNIKNIALLSIFVLLGVGNRVTNKIALVPLKDYIFFLAQFQSYSYLVFYFSILFFRYKQGIVTNDMLKYPKGIFILNGLFETIHYVLLIIGTLNLPGVLLPIIQQTSIIWQLLLSSILLKKQYKAIQLLGASFVIIGTILCTRGTGAGSSLGSLNQNFDSTYVIIFTLSFLFMNLSIVLKEKVFQEAPKKLNGKQLDLFIVNSFGSLFQVIFTILVLPVITSLRNIPITKFPEYFKEGIQCFSGISPHPLTNCKGSPFLPMLYIICNICLNIIGLLCIKNVGTVTTGLIGCTMVPLTVIAFTLPLPYIGASPPLNYLFGCGFICLTLGLLLYNFDNIYSLKNKN